MSAEPPVQPKASPLPRPQPVAAAPAPERPKAPPPRLTAHVYDEESSGALAGHRRGGHRRGAGRRRADRFIPKGDLLSPPDEPAPLGEADLQSVDAEDALAQGDVEKAKQLLEKALKTYLEYLPQFAARGGGLDPFRDAWLKLARARFFDGDQKGARDAMRFVFVSTRT